jgi:hypothetical protein
MIKRAPIELPPEVARRFYAAAPGVGTPSFPYHQDRARDLLRRISRTIDYAHGDLQDRGYLELEAQP